MKSPESQGTKDKKERIESSQSPLVSRKAQVTPRSSERIRKVKKASEESTRDRKKTKRQINQAQPGTQTSRYLYGHNMGRNKENMKRPLSFPGAAFACIVAA